MRNRKHPIIDIGSISFFADATTEQLIEVGNPENKISVMEMLTLEDHHEFLFDKQSRNIKKGEWNDLEESEDLIYIWIRRIEALDPEGMRSHEATTRIEEAAKDLPVVDISGTKFYWDRKDASFLEVNNIWNKIYKNDLTIKDGVQGFYFDTRYHHVPFPHELKGYQNGSRLPAHILFISTQDVLQQTESKNQLADASRKISVKRTFGNKKSNRL